MKRAITILAIGLAFASCEKQTKYTCQCYGGFSGGPTEQIEIKSTTRANAEQQRKAQGEPPTNVRNSCSLL
jgi:hypothetical protein